MTEKVEFLVRGRWGNNVQSGQGEVFYRLPFNGNLAWSKMMDYLAYRMLLQGEPVSAARWKDMRTGRSCGRGLRIPRDFHRRLAKATKYWPRLPK